MTDWKVGMRAQIVDMDPDWRDAGAEFPGLRAVFTVNDVCIIGGELLLGGLVPDNNYVYLADCCRPASTALAALYGVNE